MSAGGKTPSEAGQLGFFQCQNRLRFARNLVGALFRFALYCWGNSWSLSVGGNVLVGLIGTFTSIMVARLLGPTGRGLLAEAMLWPGLILIGGGLIGTQTTVFYWAKSRSHSQRSAVIGTSLLLALSLSIVLMPLAWLTSARVIPGDVHRLFQLSIVFSLTIPITLASYCLLPVFLADSSYRIYWLFRLVPGSVYAMAVAIAAFENRLTASYCVYAILLGQALQLPFLAHRFMSVYRLSPKIDTSLIRPLLSYGSKTNLSILPYTLNAKMDQAVIAILLPTSILGYYAVSVAWSSLLSFLGYGASAVLLTRSAATNIADRDSVERILSNFRILLAVLIVTAIGAALMSQLVIIQFFGRVYDPAIGPAVVLCLAGGFLNANLMLHELLRGFGQPGAGVRAELTGLLLTLVLLFALLPRLGIMGAAITSAIAYLVVFVVLVILLSNRINASFTELLVPKVSDFRSVKSSIASTFLHEEGQSPLRFGRFAAPAKAKELRPRHSTTSHSKE